MTIRVAYDPASIDWEEIRHARSQTQTEKFLEGPRLFDDACRIARDGIRHQFPNANDQEVQRILMERLEVARRLERDFDD